MEVYIITPFPDSIKTLIDNNIANQGLKKGHLSIEIVNLRDFTTDNYKKIAVSGISFDMIYSVAMIKLFLNK